jgi:hypothetical protein
MDTRISKENIKNLKLSSDGKILITFDEKSFMRFTIIEISYKFGKNSLSKNFDNLQFYPYKKIIISQSNNSTIQILDSETGNMTHEKNFGKKY